MADTDPVEVCGDAGTVVLWHYLLLHGAGVNRVRDCIRQSVIYDFNWLPHANAELCATRKQWEEEGRPISAIEHQLWNGWEGRLCREELSRL